MNTMFTRTAYQLKNRSRSTVVPTLEIANQLKTQPEWRYARITPTRVSIFRPGFGQVQTFTQTVRTPRVKPVSSPSETPVGVDAATGTIVAPRRRGRPTNAERAARIAAQNAAANVRGIAPANPTAAPVEASTPTEPTPAV